MFVNSCTYPKGRPSEISKEHIMPTKEDYSNFGSYFRSKYCITSYCLTMARKHPECHFVVCRHIHRSRLRLPGLASVHAFHEVAAPC